MPLNAVLIALIEELNADAPVALVGWRKAQAWPDGVLDRLGKDGLLSEAPKAGALECRGCEKRCFMPVVFGSDGAGGGRAFIVCDDPDMQTQMGRIAVASDELRQWAISREQVAKVVARLLVLDFKNGNRTDQGAFRLGMLKGNKGRCWVSLLVDPLRLEVNGFETLLQDVLYFDDGQLHLDRGWLDDRLNRASIKDSKEYTPTSDKQQARKLATQAMYQDWRDAYSRLKAQFPNKEDTFFAKQIAKLPIAQGRSEGRIRKMMKS